MTRRRGAIPLDELKPLLDEFNEGVEKAKDAYYGKAKGYYAHQIARSEATKRSRARKKEREQ